MYSNHWGKRLGGLVTYRIETLLMRVHRKKLRKAFLEDEAMICCNSINWANQWLSGFSFNAVIKTVYNFFFNKQSRILTSWSYLIQFLLPCRDNFDVWSWTQIHICICILAFLQSLQCWEILFYGQKGWDMKQCYCEVLSHIMFLKMHHHNTRKISLNVG